MSDYPVAPRPRAPQYPRQIPMDPGARGFIVTDQQIARAQQIPILQADGFIVAAASGAAIGKAIQDVGGAGTKLLQEHLESVQQNKVLDAQAQIDMAHDAVSAKLVSEADTTKWEGIFNDEALKLENGLLKDKKLSIDAQQEIKARLGRFKMKGAAGVRNEAARTEFKREGENRAALVITAMGKENWTEARAEVDGIARRGLAGADRIATMRVQIDEAEKKAKVEAENTRQKAAINSVQAMANADPDGAAKIVNDPAFGQAEGLEPDTITIARDRVRAAQARSLSSTQDAVADAIVTGAIKRPDGSLIPIEREEDLQRHFEDRLRPAEMEKAKAQFTAYQSQEARAKELRPENVRTRFGELLDRVQQFDREALGGPASDAARGEYADIVQETKWLPEGLRGEVTGPLYAKWTAQPPPVKEPVKAYINQSLMDMFEQNRFGVRADKVLKVKGDPGFKTWLGAGEQEFKMVTNPAGLKQAREGLARAKMALLEWENDPKNAKAGVEEAKQALQKFSGLNMSEEDAGQVIDEAIRKTDAAAVPAKPPETWAKFAGMNPPKSGGKADPSMVEGTPSPDTLPESSAGGEPDPSLVLPGGDDRGTASGPGILLEQPGPDDTPPNSRPVTREDIAKAKGALSVWDPDQKAWVWIDKKDLNKKPYLIKK